MRTTYIATVSNSARQKKTIAIIAGFAASALIAAGTGFVIARRSSRQKPEQATT